MSVTISLLFEGSCSISSEKEVIDRSVHSAAIDVSSTSFDGLVPPSPEDSYATESDPDDREYNPSDKNLSSDNEDNTASATLTKSSEKTGNQDHNDNKGRSRKRKRNQEQWKRNIIKQSRNKGLEYTNWKGKKQPARHLKYPCLNCRIKYTEKISPEDREKYSRSTGIWQTLTDNKVLYQSLLVF